MHKKHLDLNKNSYSMAVRKQLASFYSDCMSWNKGNPIHTGATYRNDSLALSRNAFISNIINRKRIITPLDQQE